MTHRPSSGGDLSSLSGRIAFDNFEDVWTIDADGTDLTRLTRAPYPEFDPSWSPDGTEIAFRSERSGEPEIWIMGHRTIRSCQDVRGPNRATRVRDRESPSTAALRLA